MNIGMQIVVAFGVGSFTVTMYGIGRSLARIADVKEAEQRWRTR